MTVWRIRVDAPAPWLTSNGRLHHLAEGRIVRKWRKATVSACEQAQLPHGITGVTIRATVHYGTSRAPVRDRPNLYPTIKAIVDGLGKPRVTTHQDGSKGRSIGYGFLIDDSDKHVVDTDWELVRSGQPGRSWVDVTITHTSPQPLLDDPALFEVTR